MLAKGFLDVEVGPDLNLFLEIEKLKKKKNAIILAHYYQEADIQDIADYIGDSLGLSQQAAKTKADIIVFAGVHFMAETAKIICPQKKVLLPDLNAGCSLADSCPADKFLDFKNKHPDHVVISYINCSAEIKALTDIICTSSNAEKIVKIKEKHPKAKLLSHPECEEAVLNVSDFIGSTTGILNYAKNSSDKEFIIATETGILHQMQKASPEKTFIPAPPNNSCACNDCPHMKLNTLEKLYICLKYEQPEILLSADLIKKAESPIRRMLELSS